MNSSSVDFNAFCEHATVKNYPRLTEMENEMRAALLVLTIGTSCRQDKSAAAFRGLFRVHNRMSGTAPRADIRARRTDVAE